MVSEEFSASQTAGANAMRRDISNFYDLKRQRVRQQRTKGDDKPINEIKISHGTTTKSVLAAKSLILKFADISVNVSTIFTSKGQGGYHNARSHALLA